MRPPIDGATIMVTGASSGIGREMARQLGPRAKALVLVARRRERLEDLRDELVAANPELVVSVQVCDLVDLEATGAMLDAVRTEVGDPDVLINNAGFGDTGLFDRTEWDKNQRMIRLNIEALTFLTQRLLPAMVAAGRGGILNVSSGFGLQFLPGFAMYVGTKHFVSGFTETLRLDLKGTGVVVSQLCPGPVETEFAEVAEIPGRVENLGKLAGLSAARCARWGLSSFERGRALIVPGWIMKVVLLLGAYTPRWVLRFLYGRIARRARRIVTGA